MMMKQTIHRHRRYEQAVEVRFPTVSTLERSLSTTTTTMDVASVNSVSTTTMTGFEKKAGPPIMTMRFLEMN